jgi:hypothetical protein
LCGVGDAFAGAVAAYLTSPRSVFAGSLAGLASAAVAAAVAGSGAAVRWLGYGGRLAPEDFLSPSLAWAANTLAA